MGVSVPSIRGGADNEVSGERGPSIRGGAGVKR